MNRALLMAGGVLCLTTVLIGAFGAHALKPILSDKAMSWIDTGVFYQAIHAIALILCGLVPSLTVHRAGMAFGTGVLLFSGSLYTMALTGSTQWAILTPIGGVCFIVGWLLFCHSVWTMGRVPTNYVNAESVTIIPSASAYK